MKFKSIVKYLKKEIFRGKIQPGDKMPSIRRLCSRFNCAKATVVRAYYQLKEEDIVYAVPGSGYYLIENISSKGDRDKRIIDFSGTELDVDSLPYAEFQSCLNQAINKYEGNLFSYTDPQGLDTLIQVMEKHLQDNQVFANDDRIFITTGSQQALNILCRMEFPNDKKKVVIEQPTYRGMVQALRLNNIPTAGVKREFDGLDLDTLEELFEKGDVNFFYTVPRFSNPLGLGYSREEKKDILRLARKYDVYIVEDDFLGDLDNDSKSDPIFAYDISDRVIYVKTFSKLLLPGLRIAVAVLPERLIDTFREYKYWSDISTPVISQGALEIYLNSGIFDLHIKKVQDLYLKRMIFLKDCVTQRKSSSIRWNIQSLGGFYTGLEILNRKKAEKIVDNLLEQNIILSNPESYYLKEFYNDKILRVSIANTDFDEIEKGIPKIIDKIEKKRFL